MKVKELLKRIILTTFHIDRYNNIILYNGYIEDGEINDIPSFILELEVKYVTVGNNDELFITVI